MHLHMLPIIWTLVALLVHPGNCMGPGRRRHGFVGYGISMYNPPCAYACRASISNPLNCTITSDSDMHLHTRKRAHGHSDTAEDLPMGDGWMVEASPSPECYATNDAFLQSLGFCIHSHCTTESTSTLQKYWEMNVAGTMPGQPLPKMSLEDAFQVINGTPPAIANSSVILYSTGAVSDEAYMVEYRTLTTFERLETTHARYGLVLLLTGAFIPIGLSFARFIPFPASWTARFEATFITPPLVGARHNIPYLWNTTIMPTRGQALFIAYIIGINIILSAVGISSARDSSWFINREREIVSYVGNRAGVLSFANIPLLVLYSSRNNVLLWLTNWSHSTFLFLHRWIAFIAVLQACLHSAIYLQIYDVDFTHDAESQLPYWYWGIIGTLGMVVIVPASLLPIRQKFYELFLAWHIFFFLLAMIGCLLHIYFRFGWQWGYENWIYMAFAIWGFDRLMRILRFARHGIRTARITPVDGEYLKLEIPGVNAEGHIYLYFPTLTWRVWENHPFSVLADTVVDYSDAGDGGSSSSSSLEAKELGVAKDASTNIVTVNDTQMTTRPSTISPQSNHHRHRHGLTLYLRTHTGITSYLRGPRTTLPVLVESGYQPCSILSQKPSDAANIIAFAGGVGVTALTAPLLKHCGWHKLFWAVRSDALVKSVRESLGDDQFDRLGASVFTGQRMVIPRILAAEASRAKGIPVTVVVSGPAGMADEVRREVARLVREDPAVVMTFAEESFSW
ncbi:ferric reductase like transmembrane component-domain-containing protein [Aspergillus pseudoustus]|uniref:Ferric reductase like transmembrane component-domain-containing protein n=1 Tax=Aspergillus pseudoustus TaxID=1810923 RepID=A0ABR4JZL4_9EURO